MGGGAWKHFGPPLPHNLISVNPPPPIITYTGNTPPPIIWILTVTCTNPPKLHFLVTCAPSIITFSSDPPPYNLISHENWRLEHPALLYIQCSHRPHIVCLYCLWCYGMYSWVGCFSAKNESLGDACDDVTTLVRKDGCPHKWRPEVNLSCICFVFYTIQMARCAYLASNWILTGWGTINTW